MKIFILIIFVHWVADFIFQDEQWAIGKSKRLMPLITHTSVYSIIWFQPAFWMTDDLLGSVIFMFVTFTFHTMTDYVTSKIVSNKFNKKQYGSPIPNFGAFTIIGFDQFLHYLQLIITWKFLFGIN